MHGFVDPGIAKNEFGKGCSPTLRGQFFIGILAIVYRAKKQIPILILYKAHKAYLFLSLLKSKDLRRGVTRAFFELGKRPTYTPRHGENNGGNEKLIVSQRHRF